MVDIILILILGCIFGAIVCIAVELRTIRKVLLERTRCWGDDYETPLR
jgi:hypothetical protein